ncbi:23S ribosomal RNA methyltransferase Erm [Saccharopolyspora taberi]|uniref:23S ribosomal RNA methyltransferase Erm n=1 Tax=Saccharopolyspora taberi TaxID=60895 RepID=UPI003CD07A31
MSARDRARRELGQNFLVDRAAARRLVRLLDLTGPTPVVELGAGAGAVTRELAGHPVTAVEIDPHWADVLRVRCPWARVVRGDVLRFAFPRTEHVVVGNLPYSQTTAIVRRLLAEPSWTRAALLVQFDVARKRADGGSMLNAQWAPWYEFRLCGRVRAQAFRPVPSVDGGLLAVRRRARPLVPWSELGAYQAMVEAVFTGRGRGLRAVLRNLRRPLPSGVPADALPKDLTPEDWARLHR